ncbi:hypothetical protein [Pollutibacter soli]|uniref:hypothetical protein n=1 Tax=Pollutibacter soli TaxID=3034157 RepID=UPI003013F28A
MKTIQIQNTLVKDFDLFDSRTKEGLLNHGIYLTERLHKESFTLAQLKSIAGDILTLWNESIGIATELFWTEMEKNNIEFERKDELIFALEKGRFRKVEMGMGARKDWAVIKDYCSIKKRFSNDEIEKISSIIESDESTRLGILKKCLKKREIPQTQYLKFGECMAYMSNCALWDRYFSKSEVDELYTIWQNFESK